MQIKGTKQIYADVLIANTICLYIHHSVYTLSTESRGAEICHSLNIVSECLVFLTRNFHQLIKHLFVPRWTVEIAYPSSLVISCCNQLIRPYPTAALPCICMIYCLLACSRDEHSLNTISLVYFSYIMVYFSYINMANNK